MKPFTRTVNPGTMEVGGRNREVFVEIVYTENGELTLHGVVGPWHSGNCAGSCGQMVSELKRISRFHRHWSREKVWVLREIWKGWHLNHLKAGCVHQDDDVAFGKLTADEKLDAPPCPVCGWKWGNGWQERKVPEVVLDILYALPETKTKPAWV